MRTADHTTYAGPGRIVLSPVPAGVPRGYRLAPRALRLRKALPAAEMQTRLAALDPGNVWAELHACTYPHEPILIASGPDVGWRNAVARWLALWNGHVIPELDPETHRPQRAHPKLWRKSLIRL